MSLFIDFYNRIKIYTSSKSICTPATPRGKLISIANNHAKSSEIQRSHDKSLKLTKKQSKPLYILISKIDACCLLARNSNAVQNLLSCLVMKNTLTKTNVIN